MAEVALPFAAADALVDQGIRGVGIGNTQECLGEAQQRDTLLRGQPILVHEGVQPAMLGAPLARRRDETLGQRCDPPALVGGVDRPLDQSADQSRFIAEMEFGDLVARQRREGCVGARLRPGFASARRRHRSLPRRRVEESAFQAILSKLEHKALARANRLRLVFPVLRGRRADAIPG